MALKPTVNSLFIGVQHIRLTRVNSTNKYAVDMVSKSKPIEGTVISASFQYEGRGQIGRYWESEDGMNITCSTILRPVFLQAQHQFYLNMAVSLAVFDLIDHYVDESLAVKIKWPNDIYVGKEKIAGILIQNTLIGKMIGTSIIGIGININQTSFSADIPNATSLKKLLNCEIDLEEAFKLLFGFLERRYLQLKSGEVELIYENYLQYFFRKGIWADYLDTSGVRFSGRILGVEEEGYLKIERKDGQIEQFAFREISFIL